MEGSKLVTYVNPKGSSDRWSQFYFKAMEEMTNAYQGMKTKQNISLCCGKNKKNHVFSYKLVDGNDDEVVFSHRGRIFYQSFCNHQLFRPPNCGEFCQIILESLFFMNH